MNELRKIKRALISVSDKNGIVEFAETLQRNFGIEIISTGGTARTLRENNLRVTDVSDVTGFPEMMNGRVKTLHPKIHGAFLALRDDAAHLAAMKAHDIEPIDLVVVNLYPFEETISDEGVSMSEAIEQIDIGGPAMIRSASKNWRDVLVVTDARLYEKVAEELTENDGAVSLETRQTFAALAFSHTANYDSIISDYLIEQLSDEQFEFMEEFDPLADETAVRTFEESAKRLLDAKDDFDDKDFSQNGHARAAEKNENFPPFVDLELNKIADLRYGENPHQRAALYAFEEASGIAQAEQLHGKEMSFNNYVDADAAWNLICDFDETACAIIKHTNPSGVGTGGSALEAYQRALATDPVSAFGGIVAFNRTIDAETARVVSEIFTEVVIASDFTEDALEALAKKKNLRVLRVAPVENDSRVEYKQISGGMLAQNADNLIIRAENLRVVTKTQPTDAQIRQMLFAWKVCKHVKSNAIVFADDVQTYGVGAGQMNRVDSIRIAALRATRFGFDLSRAALASDAFFPFRDNVDEAAKLGIKAIVQPGGSVKDEETIQAADEHEIAMVFTGARHFKH